MEQMYTLKENIYKPLIAKPAGEKIKVSHAFSRLSQVVLTYVNLFKDEAMLNRGIEEIGKLRYECSAAIAKDPHELGKVHELRNLIQVSEAIAKSALVRTESRKCHYRLDYPTRDDKNWLKWISAKLVNGSLELWTEEIPIDKWEYKPPTV
jgi:succinate dehydrogenase / fumarate reductase flavoprotein subunit